MFGQIKIYLWRMQTICLYLTLINLCKFHFNRPKNTKISMMTFNCDDPESCGIVELDEFNVVRSMKEKSKENKGNQANGAVYMFDNEVVKTLEKHKDINDISTELLPRYMGRIICWHNNLYHRDIGTPKSYEKALSEWPMILKQFRKSVRN